MRLIRYNDLVTKGVVASRMTLKRLIDVQGLPARDPRIAYCEFVGARPTDAKVAAFAFGRARGVIEGVCGALSLPITFITSPVWKRHADIPPGAEHKDLARTRAIARWPAHAEMFARKCDVDRAEAALIGWAGLRREAPR